MGRYSLILILVGLLQSCSLPYCEVKPLLYSGPLQPPMTDRVYSIQIFYKDQ